MITIMCIMVKPRQLHDIDECIGQLVLKNRQYQ